MAVAGERRTSPFGDMIRTVLVFLVILIAIVAFLLPRGHHAANTVRVDYSNELDLVQHRAPFHVLAPAGLPATWTATHVTIAVPQQGKKITTFDVGFYVSKVDAYVHLQQSDDPDLVASSLGAKRAEHGTQIIAAQTWENFIDSAGEPALVRQTSDGSTVVLSGKTTHADLAPQLAILATDLH
jgi:hypothetical protein